MAMVRDNFVPGVLNPGEIMDGNKRDKLFSPNADYFLVMQDDNNLVLYKVGYDRDGGQSNHNHAIWASGTNGVGERGTAKAQITQEGALEVRAKVGPEGEKVIWSSAKQTPPIPNSILRVQNDGQLRIYTNRDCWKDQAGK